MAKKSQWKPGILFKMDDTSKSRNFNSLRGNFYHDTVTLNLIEEEFSAKIKCCSYFSHPLDDWYRSGPETLGPTNTGYCRNSSEKLQQRLYNH